VVEPRDPPLRAASQSAWVPSTFVLKKRAGSKIAKLLCDLGREVHDRLDPEAVERRPDQGLVADVPVNEDHPSFALQLGDAATVPALGQGVENDEPVLRPAAQPS